jgi:catechol 2,3-dioxygenase-like lactoylglutathione lyase family enzyme
MIERMDNVGIVVDDLKAATAFFVELGLELEGEATVEGQWVDRVVGLDGVRNDIAMMRAPDGHGRLELMKFHAPPATTAEPNAPVNTLGIRRIMFAVEDIEDVLARRPTAPNSSASWCSTRTNTGSATSAAPRASSSRWPSSSANGPSQPTCDHQSDPTRVPHADPSTMLHEPTEIPSSTDKEAVGSR